MYRSILCIIMAVLMAITLPGHAKAQQITVTPAGEGGIIYAPTEAGLGAIKVKNNSPTRYCYITSVEVNSWFTGGTYPYGYWGCGVRFGDYILGPGFMMPVWVNVRDEGYSSYHYNMDLDPFGGFSLSPGQSTVLEFSGMVSPAETDDTYIQLEFTVNCLTGLNTFAKASCLGQQFYVENTDSGVGLINTSEGEVSLKSQPNPFNPTTDISYQLPADSDVILNVYDLAGRLVAELVNSQQQAGIHTVTFDGTKLASGVYLCRLTAGDFNATTKLMLVK